MKLDSIEFAIESLDQGLHTVMLYVAESNGSSPGRQGFSMAVNEHGVFRGTIGGGIMEVKLVELAIDLCKKKEKTPILKHQYHDKSHAKNQSGMICSGAQHVVLMPLKWKDSVGFKKMLKKDSDHYVRCDEKGLSFKEGDVEPNFKVHDEQSFELTAILDRQQTIHVFGAGHVGMALYEQLTLLDYQVEIYDNRAQFPHITDKLLAKNIRQIDYSNLKAHCNFGENDMAIIVSFSYREDQIILKQLYQQAFSYIGMMGSDAKIQQLLNECIEEGIPEADLAHVHTPIGVQIYSKTAKEIAVSIAAQIILEKNKNLPTGRTY